MTEFNNGSFFNTVVQISFGISLVAYMMTEWDTRFSVLITHLYPSLSQLHRFTFLSVLQGSIWIIMRYKFFSKDGSVPIYLHVLCPRVGWGLYLLFLKLLFFYQSIIDYNFWMKYLCH
jgi:hypothetical protein